MNQSFSRKSFLLDKNDELFEVQSEYKDDFSQRWMYITDPVEKRYSLVLRAGEWIRSAQTISITEDTLLFVRFNAALPEISADGLDLNVSFIPDGESLEISLLQQFVPTQTVWREVEIDLSWLRGKSGLVTIYCGPGAQQDSSADWLAVSDLFLGPLDKKSLNLARSHKPIREENEKNHFSLTYSSESLYTEQQNANIARVKTVKRTIEQVPETGSRTQDKIETCSLQPTPGESPFAFAQRLLYMQLDLAEPRYLEYLQEKTEKKPNLKVLSLCCGAARIEASYAAQLPDSVEWTLLDLNKDLLELASQQFDCSKSLRLIQADANKLKHWNEKWDVIMCASALHHIVELEQIVKFVSQSLTPNGEFWVIGESIGRSGNRLWPAEKQAADQCFAGLAEKYRYNHQTGNFDNELPNPDYSISCFEGIRSDEIEQLLTRWLIPVELHRRNCFMWRMLSHEYLKNYTLENQEDVETLKTIVAADVAHQRNGGRCAEMFGVFRSIESASLKKEIVERHSFLEQREKNKIFTHHHQLAGNCNVCGKQTKFYYQTPELFRATLNCKSCGTISRYRSLARGILRAAKDLLNIEANSLEELPAESLNQLTFYDTQSPFYYLQSAYPIPDLLKQKGATVELSLFKQDKPWGAVLSEGITNQNLEALTYPDGSIDVVITSDVMEHVRDDAAAHREIYRVLKPGGLYLFTVPHCMAWEETLQRVKINDPADPEKDEFLMEPEYHGDTNSDSGEGVLAYRVYGKQLITELEELGFSVEFTNQDIPDYGILNTELFYCTKSH